MIILQALLPCAKSEWLRVRQCAMGRIANLSKVLVPASLIASSPRYSESRDSDRSIQKQSKKLMGQLLGNLILGCAEEDQDIRRDSVEALHGIHRILAMRESYKFGHANLQLYAEGECWDFFCAQYAALNTLVVGSWLCPSEMGDFILTILQGITQPRVSDTDVVARTLDAVLKDADRQLSNVPLIVQSIYDHLTSDCEESLRDIAIRTLQQMTRLNPQCVVSSVLRDIPWSSAIMWQTMVSEPSLAEVVLETLLQKWPKPRHDGLGPGHNCTGYLAISHALHAILHLPSTEDSAWQLIHKLYVGMLFQIFFMLQCKQRGCFSPIANDEDMSPVNIIRHAVESMRALFQHLRSDGLVEDIEQQGGWDMLMSLDTYHTGVAVLTRALRSTALLCCPSVFEETVTTLAHRQEHKEIGTMAVFAELLQCVNITDIVEYVNGYSIPSLLQSHLKSQNSVLRDLATTSLVRLSVIPAMAVTLQDLLPEITEQLQDAHSIIGVKSVTVLHNMLHLADRQKAVPTALQLPELLLPFFLNESAQTRQRSILLCKDAMEVAGDTHTVEIKKEVCNILVPLFFHLHDEDQSVAQASWEALLCAAKLLKHRHLSYLLKTAQPKRIGECLLVGHGSRADQFLEQSLSYLCSPQEPLQRAAVRFIGLAGRHLRNGREEKLNTAIEALRSLKSTSSPSVSILLAETIQLLRTTPVISTQQALCYRLRSVWERRLHSLRAVWLCYSG
ncbi:maestro heat-like repeat-containing protein family member 7 [Lagopus muta]|uniref:maestro heat-like repeat-containing protein family member 7 n=1 Tax=Lagopus muta TaxID=64668 RepID=UPI00209EDF4A|nr:maestro heat-like repeat-containing protein family member 7 [Lagopus muta]